MWFGYVGFVGIRVGKGQHGRGKWEAYMGCPPGLWPTKGRGGVGLRRYFPSPTLEVGCWVPSVLSQKTTV